MNQQASKRSVRSALLACMLLVLVACGSEPQPPMEPAPVAPPPPAPAPAAAEPAPEPEVEPTAEEVPIEDDFADEAEQTIDEKSYRKELDALEKELEAEAKVAAATP